MPHLVSLADVIQPQTRQWAGCSAVSSAVSSATNSAKGVGKVAATAIGAGIGALVGSSVARSLDQASAARASQATTTALNRSPTGGQGISWNNPSNSGGAARGTVRITRDGQDQAGRFCREYQHKVTIGGKQERAYGTACQQPDGSWQIVG